MKFAQISKRVLLVVMVNVLVVTTITLVLGLLRVGNYFPEGGLTGLAVFCLVWGFGGAFISLAISRLMAKWMMGVQVIPPNTSDPVLQELVQTVHGLARSAGLPKLPQVGIYQSDEVNAFATGPTRSRALVAVSTGLLQRMRTREVEGVLGHEIAHVANGDMVTMTLIQGVINAFVLFLSRVLAFVISQALRSRDDRGGGGWLHFLLVMVFQVVLSILGSFVVCWFSRWREFRADAGGARLAGRESMIDALRALQRLHDPELAAAEAKHAQSFQSLKISGRRGGFMALLSTHPPLEQRIARLAQGAS
ncbi:MAG TPA: protease HtpX [Verrucomicrobiota bacterium]|jgi:heat shock protein HtpX|nr:protease HtpX [Verrucomicrobiota bacterium]HQL79482.1 protease HtpX [Verrucomicrobiota bacterium]